MLRPASAEGGFAVGDQLDLARITEKWGWKPTKNRSEFLVIKALREAGVAPAEVEQQFALGRYRLDFAFVWARSAIEADGWVHGNYQVQRRDRERDRQLNDWGWMTYRIDVAALTEDEIAVEIGIIVRSVRRWRERGGRYYEEARERALSEASDPQTR